MNDKLMYVIIAILAAGTICFCVTKFAGCYEHTTLPVPATRPGVFF